MKKQFIAFLTTFCFLSVSLFAQLEIDQANTDFIIDFDNTVTGVNNGSFEGTGFTLMPDQGELDAEAWAIYGIEDDKEFGQEETSAAFARGQSTGGVDAGGIYAFEVETDNYAIGIQPSGAYLTPGYIALKIKNTSGETIYSTDISYNIWVYNDADRSSALNGQVSTDGSTWESLDNLFFTTQEDASSDPQWEVFPQNQNTQIELENDEYLYIRWFTDDVSGSGTRDEIAIDDITINFSNQPNPEITWCNLKSPESVDIFNNETFNVVSQVYAEGITEESTPSTEMNAWIGIGDEDVHPENWDTWIQASFSSNVGDYHEFNTEIGPLSEGTHYFASRFQIGTGDYFYGGYSDTDGGLWDGTDNVSGVANVTAVIGSNCDNPISFELPLEAPINLTEQSTCGMVNLYYNTCLENYDSGQDIIYNITLTEPAIVNIDFDPINTVRTGIAIYDGCPDVGQCLDYAYDNTSDPRNINIPLQSGSYFIIIDQWVITDNCNDDFNLDITIDDDECLAPTNLAADINGNQATISWTPGLAETEWHILYGIQGFDTDTDGTLIESVDTNPYTLSDLNFNTNYQLYIRSNCDVDEFSDWSEPISFNTCEVITEFPWTETFEEDSEHINCWRQSFVEGQHEWTFENGAPGGNINNAYSGNRNAVFYKHSAEFLVTRLMTPIINTDALVNPVLTFWYGQQEWDQDQNELKVYYRTAQGQGWTLLQHFNQEADSWTKVLIDFPETSETFQIAFEGIHNYGRANVLDNVSVREFDDVPHIIDVDIHEQVQNITVELYQTEETVIELLAQQITLLDSDGDEYIVDLDWTIDNYDNTLTGDYDATGTFDFPEGMLQSDPPTELTVNAIVTVDTDVNVLNITKSDLSIYPNPNSGEFYLNLSKISGKLKYSVFDTKGSIIYSDIISGGSDNVKIKLNLKPGIYYIDFTNDEVQKTQKLIIK